MEQCQHVEKDGRRCPRDAKYMWATPLGEWVWSCAKHRRRQDGYELNGHGQLALAKAS